MPNSRRHPRQRPNYQDFGVIYVNREYPDRLYVGVQRPKVRRGGQPLCSSQANLAGGHEMDSNDQ